MGSVFHEDVAYRPWTNADLAARFGRKVVDALIDGTQTVDFIEHYARLAGSYGQMALDETTDQRELWERHTADVLAWYR